MRLQAAMEPGTTEVKLWSKAQAQARSLRDQLDQLALSLTSQAPPLDLFDMLLAAVDRANELAHMVVLPLHDVPR